MINKEKIIDSICYTELVYGRIKKKLSIQMTNEEIENYLLKVLKDTPLMDFEKKGKNYYISNYKQGIRVTVNSYTTRIITVDRLNRF